MNHSSIITLNYLWLQIIFKQMCRWIVFKKCRWVVFNCVDELSPKTVSMSCLVDELSRFRWESLHKRRKGSKLILLVKGLKCRANIPCNDLQPSNKHSRNQHPMAFQVPYARTDIYKYSFFPDTISDWNALPASIISSAESSEDSVTRFTSLMRAGLVFAIVGPGEWISIE